MFSSSVERLSHLVRERREQCGTPGVALAVVYGNEVVFAKGFGMTSTDPEQAVPITPTTVFRIGSSTKPLTGTLLMRLVEAGKLSLDEPIVTYLPWFTLSDPEASHCVTLRHLMSHQAGLPWGSQFFGYRDPEGLETYVRESVPRLPMIAPPGTLFSYSNVGVNVSGCVAQAVGGAPFAELMRTWVFEPLGMERSTFDPLRAIAFPLAQAHEKVGDTIRVKRGEPWAENVAYHPSAMAYSTVLDMANFARIYLNQGEWEGWSFLTAESVAEMHRTQVDEYQRDGRTVGLNFALTEYRGLRRVGHGGGISSFGSVFTMLPEVGVAVLMQFNHDGFWQATEEIIQLVFDIAIERRFPAGSLPVSTIAPTAAAREPDRDRWQSYVGAFLGARAGLAIISIAADGETLTLARAGKPGEVALTPLRDDFYSGRNPQTGEEEVIGFIASKKGTDTGNATYIMLNGVPCVRVERNPAFVANPTEWQIYTGTYEGSDETSPTGRDVLRLYLENDSLMVHSQNRARAEVAIPWDSDCFIYRERFLRFQRATALSFTLGDPTIVYHQVFL